MLWLSACGGCQPSIHDPTPPDVSELQAIYDSPPGRLTADGLKESVASFVERTQTEQSSTLPQVLTTMVDQAQNKTHVPIHHGTQATGARSKLLAVVEATRICRGPTGDSVVDKRFGTAHVTLKGGARGIFPIVWGTFDQCVEHGDNGPVTIDGDFWIDLRNGNALYRFEGTLQSDEAQYDGVLDFRELADGTLEVRVHGAEGDVIFGGNAHGRGMVRDRDHRWICDFTIPKCSSSSGEVLAEESGS